MIRYSDDGGLLIPPFPHPGLRQICAQKTTLYLEDLLCCYLFFYLWQVSLFSPFKYQIEFIDIIGVNNMGMEEKVSPGDDCGKRQMERESKIPTSLIGPLETGRERLSRTPVPVRGMLCFWIGGPPVKASLDQFYFCFDKKIKGN